MKIIVVRHGETAWNAEDRIQSYHHNSPYTDRGLRQIDQLTRQLAKKKIDVIYTSCLSRCIKTAEKIIESHAEEVPVVLDQRLKQKFWGTLEGMKRSELGQKFTDSGYAPDGSTIDWNMKKAFHPPGGGESWNDVSHRIEDFLRFIFKTHAETDTIMILTHSAISRIILSVLVGVGIEKIHPEIKRRSLLHIFKVKKFSDHVKIFNFRLMTKYRHKPYNAFHIEAALTAPITPKVHSLF